MCQCILIPIKRLNDTSVDYIFYYKYMLSMFTYIARKKEGRAKARAQSTRTVILSHQTSYILLFDFHLHYRLPNQMLQVFCFRCLAGCVSNHTT